MMIVYHIFHIHEQYLSIQGRIQDFLIAGESNNLGYRGRGTKRANRVTSEESINQLGVQGAL